jgi:hypothetical protein
MWSLHILVEIQTSLHILVEISSKSVHFLMLGSNLGVIYVSIFSSAWELGSGRSSWAAPDTQHGRQQLKQHHGAERTTGRQYRGAKLIGDIRRQHRSAGD